MVDYATQQFGLLKLSEANLKKHAFLFPATSVLKNSSIISRQMFFSRTFLNVPEDGAQKPPQQRPLVGPLPVPLPVIPGVII